MNTETNAVSCMKQTAQPTAALYAWTYRPDVDIVEMADEWQLSADVPGASAGDLDVNYERGVLTIHARVSDRQAADTRFVSREYGVGDYFRRFEIGEGFDAAGVRAELATGVLTLHLPKAARAKPRKIAVQAR